ncbi:MAG: hypothetical protein ACOCVG_04400 [Verrucomicrobiota bacterium]
MVKWPFWFGDLVLVSLGLLLAVSKWGELSGAEMALCVGSVMLGVVLFTVPYFFEFRAEDKRSQLDADQVTERADRVLDETIKVLRSYVEQSQRTELNLEAVENTARRIEEQAEDFKRTREAVSEVIGKLSELAERDMAQPDIAERVSSHIGAVQQQLEGLTGRLQGLDSLPESISSLHKELTSSEREPAPGIAKLFEEQRTLLQEMRSGLGAIAPELSALKAAVAQAEAEDKPAKESVVRTARLLEKALSGAEEGSNPAVSRMISGNTPPPVAKPTTPSDNTPAPTSDPKPESASLEPAEADAAPQPEPSEAAEATSPPTEEAAPPTEPGLGLDLPAPAEKPSKRIPAGHLALVAECLVGIGNRLFIRGDGPGLSWSKGVPLDFVEIGKWRWVSQAKAEEPAKVRIFLNDETPARGDTLILQPGKPIGVRPKFDQ